MSSQTYFDIDGGVGRGAVWRENDGEVIGTVLVEKVKV